MEYLEAKRRVEKEERNEDQEQFLAPDSRQRKLPTVPADRVLLTPLLTMNIS